MDVGIRLIAEHLHVKYTTDDTDVQQGRKGAPPVLVLWGRGGTMVGGCWRRHRDGEKRNHLTLSCLSRTSDGERVPNRRDRAA